MQSPLWYISAYLNADSLDNSTETEIEGNHILPGLK